MAGETVVYVCKTCGRSMKSPTPPKYCYADRMDTLENISDPDAQKMGLFPGHIITATLDGITYEFPSDIKYDPVTGESLNVWELNDHLESLGCISSLSNHQTYLMRQVRS